MENNKNVKMALIIVTMLIITITSVMSVAVIYELLMETKNDIKTPVSNNLNNRVEEESTIENSFTTYQENYQESIKQINGKENEIFILLGENRQYELPGVEKVYIDINNDAYLKFVKKSELYKKYGEKLKVESNVANIFVYPTGSGGYSEAIFLKFDGTASSIHGYNIEKNKAVEVESVEGIKDAINVISYMECYYNENGEYEGETPTIVFIDINGNIIK